MAPFFALILYILHAIREVFRVVYLIHAVTNSSVHAQRTTRRLGRAECPCSLGVHNSSQREFWPPKGVEGSQREA